MADGNITVERIQLGAYGFTAFRVEILAGQRGRQPLGIKHRVVLEHVIDRAGQLDGQDGVGLEMVAVHPRFQSLIERADVGHIAFGNN